MRPFLFLTPAVSLGLVAAGLLTPPVHAAAPQATPAAFTPVVTYVTCPVGEALPDGTRCATLTVPLDWQTPDDGRTIELALRVKRSQQRGGALTFNPGGPGESGIDLSSAIYSLLPAQVRDRFDFVSWDPRGVGRSEPALIDCTGGDASPPNATGPVDWQAYWQAQLAARGAANSACLMANQEAAPYLGTWQVIRDLEAMRVALGYSQWNYWGMSYGTRIGNAYARTFPTSLRALIMDGSVMAGETLYRFGTTFPAGVQVSEQVYASLIGRAQAHKINTIFAFLDSSVVALPDGNLTRWDFAAVLRQQLTHQANYSAFRTIVNTIYDAITTDTPSARKRAGRELGTMLARLPRTNPKEATLRLINCADLHDRPTAAQLAAASIAAERQYGTESVLWMVNASICEGLPADMAPASPSGTGTVTLANPPMFVLSTGDAATPWIWGRGMANTFARSRVVSYASTQHVNYLLTPSTCLNNTVTRYLLTLQRPSRDILCDFAPSPAP